MNPLIQEPLGWLALLARPGVALQFVLMVLVLVALARLRRFSPRLAVLPPGLALLPALALLGGVLALARAQWGLVLLAGQILAVWLLLRLVELRLLGRWLPADQLGLLVSRLFRPLFLVGVLLVVLDALGSLESLAAQPLGVWFGTPIQLGRMFEVLLVLYLVGVGSELPSNWLAWLAQRSLGISHGGRRALSLVIRYVLVALSLIWALQRLGINQTGLLAVAGGLSVGLGFGVKEVFSNFISGIWLLFEGSVRPGEVLMLDGEACEVRRLGLRAATLWRGSDNAELVVPNQTFFTHTTTTYTRSDRMRRCRFELEVPSSWPPQSIIELLESIVAVHPEVIAQPPPHARLIGFDKDLNRFGLSFSIADPLIASRVTAQLRLQVWETFQSRGIFTKPPQEGEEPSPGEEAGSTTEESGV